MASPFNLRGEPNDGDALFFFKSPVKILTPVVKFVKPYSSKLPDFAVAYNVHEDQIGRFLGLFNIAE